MNKAARKDAILNLRNEIDPGGPIVIEETMTAGEARVRRLDVVGVWQKSGEITDDQHAAALIFANDFDTAGLQDRFSVQCFDRVDSSPNMAEPERVMQAKDRVRQAMYVTGQIGGSAMWDIVGLGHTMKQYVANHSWTRSNQTEVKGALKCALSTLVWHYRV